MTSLLSWLKEKTAQIADPHRQQRIERVARYVEQEMKAKRTTFNFEKALQEQQSPQTDDLLVAQRVYERAVQRVWSDFTVTDKEKAALRWVAAAVSLGEKQTKEIEFELGLKVFEKYLAKAAADGQITADEMRQLNHIAEQLNSNPAQLMSKFFKSKGESLFRNMFTELAVHGRLNEQSWNNLLHVAAVLGLSEDALYSAIETQAVRLVEHVLADAKQDDELSEAERHMLKWLLTIFRLPADYEVYVRQQLQDLMTVTSLKKGDLPQLTDTQSILKAGEIAHLECNATYGQLRNRKSGASIEHHSGLMTITDARMMFASESKTFNVNHRKVTDIRPHDRGFQLLSAARGTGTYFVDADPQISALIYRAAVDRANQTLTSRESRTSRHIPREIRQRVWQKYGGRCAECGADQYLEFDHIIPHAKGGSNSESNVQLLCRACNLKKSDRI